MITRGANLIITSAEVFRGSSADLPQIFRGAGKINFAPNSELMRTRLMRSREDLSHEDSSHDGSSHPDRLVRSLTSGVGVPMQEQTRKLMQSSTKQQTDTPLRSRRQKHTKLTNRCNVTPKNQ